MQTYTAKGGQSVGVREASNLNELFTALDENANTRQRELVRLVETRNKELARFTPAALAESTAVAVRTAQQLETLVASTRKQASDLGTARELAHSAAPVLAALTALRTDVAALHADNAHLREDNARLRDSLQAVLDSHEATRRAIAAQPQAGQQRACCVMM